MPRPFGFTRRRFLQSTSAAALGAGLTRTLSTVAYAAPAAGDWSELFDGKTLTGWHKNPERIGHGTGGIWQVEDGTIT